MFVQVFQGKVSDPEKVRSGLERWTSELAPGATGWLGSTAGVTDDGTLVALARFASEADARANSARPEQGAWWNDMAALFTGEPQFHDSTYVEVDQHGDPGDAGFVQVMQGRSRDPDRARELMAADPTDWAAYRPDILGTVTVGHEDAAWTMVIYFASEEAAREGEGKPPPPELADLMAEIESLADGEPSFFDLRDPWLAGP